MKRNIILFALLLCSCNISQPAIYPIPAPVPNHTETWLGEHAFNKADAWRYVDWMLGNGDCDEKKCEE